MKTKEQAYDELIEVKVTALRELAKRIPIEEFFYIGFENGDGHIYQEGSTLSYGGENFEIGNWYDKYWEQYVRIK